MAKRNVVVGPHKRGGWAVKKHRGERATAVMREKADAIAIGRRAATTEGSELIIKNEHGKIVSRENCDSRKTGR